MPTEPKGTFDLDSVSPVELDRIVTEMGGQRVFSRHYGVARSTLQLRLNKVHRDPYSYIPVPEPRVEAVGDRISRFILTSAQDETSLHEDFLTNLEAYRDFYIADGSPCEIMIGGYTYNKRLFTEQEKDKQPSWHYRIAPYLVSERIRLGDAVEFCGEMNTSPTATTPLTGFETYTKTRWGIFPHAKLQLQSVPTMKHSPVKINMTTGSVTRPNYVKKRAGIKAQFHHQISAVLVEIAPDGTFFCRHLDAEDDGSFFDLDIRVQTMKDKSARGNTPAISRGHRIEAINYGDLHVAQIDPVVAKASFGYWPETHGKDRIWRASTDGRNMLDELRPKFQFFHDVSDFQARNHHNVRDPHHMYALFIEGVDSVEDEMHEVARFIDRTKRDFCETVVVESNHDLALKRWLKEADYRTDPLNAEFFLSCQKETYKNIRLRNKGWSVFDWVLCDFFDDANCSGVKFLREDESFKVFDIEKGMHGHLGANGARGTPKTFTRAGSKSTTGHTHSCAIIDGAFVTGTTSLLDMGYNKGMSSWSQSHVITYQNGKRAIITMQGGKWRL